MEKLGLSQSDDMETLRSAVVAMQAQLDDGKDGQGKTR